MQRIFVFLLSAAIMLGAKALTTLRRYANSA